MKKQCSKCRVQKNINEFFTDSRHVDKLTSACKQCHRDWDYKHRRLPEVRIHKSKKAIERMQKLRQQIFDKFGSQCEWCGNIEEKMLTIDHKNNDGARHRKQLNRNQEKLCREIIADLNSKQWIQILCMGCNWARRIYQNDSEAKIAVERNLTRIRNL